MTNQTGANVESLTTSFSADVFDLDTVKKAAYPFTDRASFDFRIGDAEILVRMDFTAEIELTAANTLIADFRNEVLDQDLRQKISEETAPVRNVILGYAFSRTGLQGE